MARGSSIIRATIPEESAARARALGARYGVRNIRVFGSVARGEAAQDSDIASAIEGILACTSDGRESFSNDSRTQDAVIRNLEIIGEAIRGISPATREAHPDVPWKQIAGSSRKSSPGVGAPARSDRPQSRKPWRATATSGSTGSGSEETRRQARASVRAC